MILSGERPSNGTNGPLGDVQGLEVRALDLDPRHQPNRCGQTGRHRLQAQAGIGHGLGIDRDHDHVLRRREAVQLGKAFNATHLGHSLQQDAQPEIVGNAPVHKMDVLRLR